jgi:hypothetical protein
MPLGLTSTIVESVLVHVATPPETVPPDELCAVAVNCADSPSDPVALEGESETEVTVVERFLNCRESWELGSVAERSLAVHAAIPMARIASARELASRFVSLKR